MGVGRWGVAALLPLCVGCFDTEARPPPDVDFAIFDPAGMPPRIPLPNDLTMLPAPANAPAVAAFSAPVNSASITPASVIVLDVVAMAPVSGATAAFDPQANRLIISPPPTGWPIGHRIAIALRGGSGGLMGEGGVPVVASPAFYFARSATPLVTCAPAGANCASVTPALPLDQALALEQLRQA